MIFHNIFYIGFDVFFEAFRIGRRHFPELLECLFVLAGKLIIVVVFAEQQADHLAAQEFFPDDIVPLPNPGNGQHRQNQESHIAQQGIHPGYQLGETAETADIAQDYNANDITMHFAYIIPGETAGGGVIKTEGRVENQGKGTNAMETPFITQRAK